MKMIDSRRGIARSCGSRILLGLLFIALAGSSAAQDLGVTSTEPGLPVTLDGAYKLSSLTPFTHSMPGGDFRRIRAGGGAFVLRRASLSWDDQGRPFVINRHRSYALLGTLLPGTGSMASGRWLHGCTELAAVSYLVGGGLKAVIDVDSAAEDYNDLFALFEAEEDLEKKREIEVRVAIAYRSWELRNDHLKRQNALTGVYAGLIALESWWFNRPLEARARARQLVLNVPRLSRGKAIAASFFFPGMGQAYRGQSRGALYVAAQTFLLQEILDVLTRREIHKANHAKMERYYLRDGLDTEEVLLLRDMMDKQQRSTEELQLFTGLASAVWLVNMLDVIGTRPEQGTPSSGGRFTLATSPGGRPGLAWSRRF